MGTCDYERFHTKDELQLAMILAVSLIFRKFHQYFLIKKKDMGKYAPKSRPSATFESVIAISEEIIQLGGELCK